MARVLIIEDEIIIARFIETHLTRELGCETRISLNAQDARLKMQYFRPHLLLCDINLRQGVSGVDLVHSFRENYQFEVIYITSYDHPSIVIEARTTSPANYLVKPINEEQLIRGVRPVLRRIRAI